VDRLRCHSAWVTSSAIAVRHAFTVDEWHRMGEAGLFGDSARMEVLDWEVIEMSPIGSPHASCVARLTFLLIEAVGSRALIFPQSPVALDPYSEPQPDIAALAPRPEGYSRSHPDPSEIRLLIEVADSTLAFDRDVKSRVYARSGVRQTWIVDLAGDQVLVMGSPGPDGYRRVDASSRSGELEIESLAGVRLSVAEVLGPEWPMPASR
jgi:Uma2 family endonuclease